MKENLQCEKQALEYKDHDLSKHLNNIVIIYIYSISFFISNFFLIRN